MIALEWRRALGLAMILGLLVGPAVERPVVAQDAKDAEAKAVEADKADEKADEKAEPARVAVFRLAGPVKETSVEDLPLFGGTGGVTLRDLVTRLHKAAEDDEVKAVVLLGDGGSAGQAQVEELRQAIGRVKDAGKPVYAHADSLTMSQYVLFSAVTRLSVVPTADLWVTGFYAEAPYLRGLLDKLDVRPDFVACGDFKSASEIFLREGPSPEAERMQNWLLDSLYATTLDHIARARDVPTEKVGRWIDGGPYTAEQAKEAGLIDAVEHRQDLEALLKTEHGEDVVFDKKYGKKSEPKPDLSSPLALFRLMGEMMGGSQAKKTEPKTSVAIVHVEGPIVLSEDDGLALLGGGTSAVAGKIRRALDDAAQDDTIKAVVLRVDSPGGSAVASEIILDAARRVAEEKPLAVSMGNVAASGGYYVAMASETIFADRTTITGSIGVVGGKLATEGLFEKAGVRFQSYKRGENAGMLASSDPFTDQERRKLEAWMGEIYEVFQGHVRSNRGEKLSKPLDELIGGRVFTGAQARELGLVDEIGTQRDAIEHVATLADLGDDYEVRVVPRPKSFLEQLLEDPSAVEDRKGLELAADASRPLLRRPGSALLDLAAPLVNALDARRASLVWSALGRLELLNREGVILMMPELHIGD